jgi:hypothetical protein
MLTERAEEKKTGSSDETPAVYIHKDFCDCGLSFHSVFFSMVISTATVNQYEITSTKKIKFVVLF